MKEYGKYGLFPGVTLILFGFLLLKGGLEIAIRLPDVTPFSVVFTVLAIFIASLSLIVKGLKFVLQLDSL